MSIFANQQSADTQALRQLHAPRESVRGDEQESSTTGFGIDLTAVPATPQGAQPAGGPEFRVGDVGDRMEHEADYVAGQVGGTPADARARFDITRDDHGRGSGAGNLEGEARAQVHEALAEPGLPLDGTTRGAFESRLGRDLSGVRVHSGAAAARSAQALDANAYTVGDAIVFGHGRFEPHSAPGRQLLAHELTHVAQQACQPKAVPSMVIRRNPAGPAGPPSVPILGGGSPGATESLYHYGDLEGATSLKSPRGYPRLTDCDIATTVEEVVEHTGTPVRPSLKYKYELKINRAFFQQNFQNVATRPTGYSEYGTNLSIPREYFRKVLDLTRGPSGTVPPVAGGGGAAGGGATGGSAAGTAPAPAPTPAPKPPTGTTPTPAPKPTGAAPTPKPPTGAVQPAVPPGAVTEGAAEGAGGGALSKVPGGVVRGAEGGAEGAAAGAAARGVLRGGLRFLGGAAIGVAIGLLASYIHAVATRKLIEGDIQYTLKNIPDDRQQKIQARIDALPAGKKKFARITLDYGMFRSTLGVLGGPDAYDLASVRLIGVHAGNEELDFPPSVSETPGEAYPVLATRRFTIRISYTVPID
ncbi:eCIS core domain-containing protein [Nocardia altamirensis]|uniref:eCIS core domain-containing protein n=1 Tax=Nocardia altamirensis TaxID=472158 RepID=UPI000840001B|nr:DUF4157 domain-containing protein [Nocardia altamirensis]